MHFKLFYGNHWNFGLGVAETLLMVKYGLNSLGYRADIAREFTPGYINISVENYSPEFVSNIESEWTPGTELIIIATEILTGNTFNDCYFDAEELANERHHYQDKELWQGRYNTFARLADRASAIWHLGFQEVPKYAHQFTNTRVGYLAHGFVDKFPRVEHLNESEKDIDVFFSGTTTRYRTQIIELLQNAGLKVYMTHPQTPAHHRDDLVARARVSINVKQNPQWKFESNSRLHYHISNASLILTEHCEEPSDLNHFVRTVDGNWVEVIQEELAKGHFYERGAEVRDRFRADRPMEKVLEPLIEHLR